MIYGGFLLLIVIVLFVTKRSVGGALLTMIAMATVAGLLAGDLVNFVMSLTSSLPKNLVEVIIRSVLVLIPSLIVLIRSAKTSKRILILLTESALIAGLSIALLATVLTSVVKLDPTSVQIGQWVLQNSKLIIVGAGLYGFYQIIAKHDDA